MPEDQPTPPEAPQEQTFTQADVDRIVRDRVKRERERFADYDALKAQAEGAKTAEQRIADLEKRLADADAREQRTRLVQTVAKAHGITDPDDVALFLTGSDGTELFPRKDVKSWRPSRALAAFRIFSRSSFFPVRQI